MFMVAAFVFPTTAVCAEALPWMWPDTCLPMGINKGSFLFPLLTCTSFSFLRNQIIFVLTTSVFIFPQFFAFLLLNILLCLYIDN